MTTTADISPEFKTQIANILHDYGNITCQYDIYIPEINDTLTIYLKYKSNTKSHCISCWFKATDSNVENKFGDMMNKISAVNCGFYLVVDLDTLDYRDYSCSSAAYEYIYVLYVLKSLCKYFNLSNVFMGFSVLTLSFLTQSYLDKYTEYFDVNTQKNKYGECSIMLTIKT